MGYTLTASTLRALKAAVIKAQNKRDWMGVIVACDQALAVFAAQGHPEQWADFVRHREDAEVQLKLHAFSGPIFY
jgi:hypothetical protein